MAQLAHHVFFTLKDNGEDAIQHMLAACRKYLDGHDGTVSFSVGVRDTELSREVNRAFDVSLHVVFEDRSAHDTYQVHERHLQFIEENKANWAEVEVCDSLLQ